VCNRCGKSLAAPDAPFSSRPYWLIALAAALGLTLWVF
jgi:hypothetical protein